MSTPPKSSGLAAPLMFNSLDYFTLLQTAVAVDAHIFPEFPAVRTNVFPRPPSSR